MNDPTISLSRIVTSSAWSITAGLIGGAWATYFVGDDGVTQLLGYTGCGMSAVAATLNVRCYAMRLSRLVRVTNGLTDSPRPLRSIAD